MLIVRHLGTPNSDFNGCHCMRGPVLYRSMGDTRTRKPKPVYLNLSFVRKLRVYTLRSGNPWDLDSHKNISVPRHAQYNQSFVNFHCVFRR